MPGKWVNLLSHFRCGCDGNLKFMPKKWVNLLSNFGCGCDRIYKSKKLKHIFDDFCICFSKRWLEWKDDFLHMFLEKVIRVKRWFFAYVSRKGDSSLLIQSRLFLSADSWNLTRKEEILYDSTNVSNHLLTAW